MNDVMLSTLLNDLVLANHILAREGVCDYLGHASVRHPARPDRFFLSCSRAPELVSLEDLMEFDLDTNPIDQLDRPMYAERPIHGAIYAARPDVMAVIHNHAYEVIPYGLAGVRLGAVIHPACGIGSHVPIWDIRDRFGDTSMLVTTMAQGQDLAAALGRNGAALMAGHGCVVGAASLREAVMIAVYMKVNAAVQSEASRLGSVRFLSDAELALAQKVQHSENSLSRAWQYWTRRCGG